jgi:hypothetical protein
MSSKTYEINENGNLIINNLNINKTYKNFDLILNHRHITLIESANGIIKNTPNFKIAKIILDRCEIYNKVQINFTNDKIDILAVDSKDLQREEVCEKS